MDVYLLFKFLHISSAVVWVGASVCLAILGAAADRQQDRAGFTRVIRDMSFLAPRLFVPISLATFLLGVIAAWLSWSFSDLWVVIGIVGFAATFCTGNFLLKPRSEKIAAIVAAEGASDRAVAVGRELLAVAKFDQVMLFVVIADMAFKPTPGDWPVLALMALAVIGGAVFFLVPAVRAPAEAAAA